MNKKNGLLIVGDPHLTSRQISKRHDLVSTMETCLDKLSQVVKIANRENLFVVFLGDFFDSDKENNIYLLTKTIRILKSLDHKPLTIVGNHEKTEDKLADYNMLVSLIEANVMDVFIDNKITQTLELHDKTLNKDYHIAIGGTNYGSKIPDKVTRPENIEKLIWITHHDLLFKSAYPGAVPLKEIDGVDLVINGHMHKAQPQQQEKTTTWCCPGNILRQTVDLAEQKVCVFMWTLNNHENEYKKLIPIELEYQKDIFKKPEVIEADIDARNDYRFNVRNSEKMGFVEALEAIKIQNDNNVTDDRAVVIDGMNVLFEAKDVPEDIRQDLLNLANSVEL